MKNTVLSLLFIALVGNMFAQETQHEITINITNISNDTGQVIIKLYNSEESYRKKVFKRKICNISKGKARVIFNNIPSGNYAFAVVHDENKNNKIDFNFLGIPSENVASSNNAAGFMGPPNFEDSKFKVNGKSVVQNIKM